MISSFVGTTSTVTATFGVEIAPSCPRDRSHPICAKPRGQRAGSAWRCASWGSPFQGVLFRPRAVGEISGASMPRGRGRSVVPSANVAAIESSSAICWPVTTRDRGDAAGAGPEKPTATPGKMQTRRLGHLTIAPPFIETGEYAGITKRERKQEGNKDSASSGAIIIFPPGPIEGGAGVKFGGSRETRDQVDERRFSDYRPASIGAGRESNSQGRGDGFRASTGNVGGCLRCRNQSPPSTSRGIDVVLKQASALLAIQSRVISSKPKETTRLRLDRQAPIDAHQNPPDGPLDHLADLSVQTAAKSISYSVAHLPWTSTPLRLKLYS